ncbi:putative nucleotidyltransferase component of viral defense system [Rhodoglobus vestalii]|uniref:Putative nucleotidyltransferase component of viral defense system n=1 Tax=Rhodoglobus vestalii TaxID=193384 RepID=A0A8H2K6I6_9MICO|nr:nucleotidyl transferase AbiEii/AbiGii toxin family protein [Rhodoglobus vestalii]TQO19594.1 putative nucleotidyltransferase component of viral defense system [Rhodoglobus vestalii]
MTPEQTFTALQRIARQQGRAVQELLTLYVLEQFLARLGESTFADSFVLKGGVLLAGYGLRRPTRDVDMQAIDFVLNEEHCREVAAAVARADADDGVVFEAVPIRIEQIRDEEEYSGIRVHIRAHLHSARIAVKLDISTGDPMFPEAQRVTMPRILGGEFTLMGYALETVIAEKAVTILQRGVTSTRWRDYMDLRSLSRSRSFEATILLKATEEVAKYRGVILSAPSVSLSGHDEIAQQKWAAWRTKSDVEDITLAVLKDQLTEVSTFLDPIFLNTVDSAAAWHPTSQAWI